MGTIEQGVRQVIDNCLRIRPGERVVVITDRPTLSIGEALRVAAAKIVGEVQFFLMEDFGARPVAFPSLIAEALRNADVSIYAAQGAEGELQTFRKPMLKAVDANPKLRHAHMIGITPQIMTDGMCSDYLQIQRISKQVYDIVHTARAIRVVTAKGCDFTARFSRNLKWIISDGDIRPRHWTNLPDGEVFTAPATVDGRVVIDGCLGDYFTERYASLAETPVTVDVRDGCAIRESLRCDNEQLRRELAAYVFETDANSNRVGEFAIGTNTGLTRLIYNLLQDEKFPGIHIAFGSPYPAKTGATWDSAAHVDGVIIAPSIYVDGRTLMDQGRFRLD
ncbi:MAG TPA: aminopeptidase [Sedimentisphaerales bacterium]|nr:aminopeptidase [Sedimentisphaerales bacterium]HRS13072.1 aminopeptidase [Sedimentisphaerales bacterium]HRV49654.1 aminopeptidase [Sedimentisphaerales bacterium]